MALRTYNSKPFAHAGAEFSASSLRLAVQDAALSRLKHGFDSRRERQLHSRPTHVPAGLGRRLAAALYDTLLLGGILMASSYAVVMVRGGAVPTGNIAFRIFVLAQCAAFFAGFWAYSGQTLGMRSWRIRVETTEGHPPPLAVALLRFFAALVSLAPLGLGYWWIVVDPERRTWHDRATGTRVIRVPG